MTLAIILSYPILYYTILYYVAFSLRKPQFPCGNHSFRSGNPPFPDSFRSGNPSFRAEIISFMATMQYIVPTFLPFWDFGVFPVFLRKHGYVWLLNFQSRCIYFSSKYQDLCFRFVLKKLLFPTLFLL